VKGRQYAVDHGTRNAAQHAAIPAQVCLYIERGR
jgi:hypothetical protein